MAALSQVQAWRAMVRVGYGCAVAEGDVQGAGDVVQRGKLAVRVSRGQRDGIATQPDIKTESVMLVRVPVRLVPDQVHNNASTQSMAAADGD
jgi:hypothetical protein